MPVISTCNKVFALIIQPNFYFIKTLSFILALIAFVACALLLHKHSLEIVGWLEGLGWLAPVLFVITYTLATLFFLPTMVLTLAGGALFGPAVGTVFNLIGATCGAALSFLITRHLVYNWFSKRRGPRLKKLIVGVEQKGWMFVAFVRLFPVIPFNLVNYGMGLTSIPFRLYLITTAFFLIPAEIIYTYFGYAGRHVLAHPSQFYKSGGMVLLGIALLFLVIITVIKRREQNKIFSSNAPQYEK